jgi:predicted nucleic acid-binding protein
MPMPDVNVLVYAHREESPGHDRYAAWLTEMAEEPEPFALSEPVLQGFIRIVANPRIFSPPSTTAMAFRFIESLMERPGRSILRPGPDY